MNELPEVLHPYREIMYEAIERDIWDKQSRLWLQIDTLLYFHCKQNGIEQSMSGRQELAETISDPFMQATILKMLNEVSQLSAELQSAYNTIWGVKND